MRVLWTPEAHEERRQIWDYIAEENPLAAARMDQRFADTVAMLSQHPEIGRPGLIIGTREMIPHESYRIVYEMSGDSIWILAVVHTARLWPPL